jgi:hypothetical protein
MPERTAKLARRRVADAASNDEQGFQIFPNETRCSNDEQRADARR